MRFSRIIIGIIALVIAFGFVSMSSIDQVTSHANAEEIGGYSSNERFLAPIIQVTDLEAFSEYKPISSRADLEKIGKDTAYPLNGKYYLLTDIDLSGENWIPIGSEDTPFEGTLDGNGHHIHGMSIRLYDGNDWVYAGLFTKVKEGLISNLTLEDVDMYVSSSYCVVGAFAGHVSSSTIANCSVTGSIQTIGKGKPSVSSGGNYTGGIAGIIVSSSIIYTSNSAKIKGLCATHGGNANTGGIAGKTYLSSIENCFNSGAIEVIASYYETNYQSGASISGGGIAGDMTGTSIYGCYNSGIVSSHSIEFPSSDVYSGGIVGVFSSADNMEVVNCYNTGRISSAAGYSAFSGGIIGLSFDDKYRIKNCFNVGKIIAEVPYSSSLFLSRTAAISAAYSGFYVENCYYLEQAPDDHVKYVDISDEVQSLSEAEMQQQSSFLGWDFNVVWKMPEGGGYPVLQRVDSITSDYRYVLIEYNQDHDSGRVNVKWGEKLFEKSSTEANEDLALLAAALNTAAGDKSGYRMEKAYQDLHFKDENIYFYSYKDHPKNQGNVPGVDSGDEIFAFSIAHKELSISGEKTNVIAIVLRGTATFSEGRDVFFTSADAEFYDYKVHGYFLRFMENVWEGLKHYVSEHPGVTSGKTKFLISGHSLGGAAANLLAAKMMMLEKFQEWKDIGLPRAPEQKDIYAYTFGALNTFDKFPTEFAAYDSYDYRNIWNYFNYYDTYGPYGEGFWGQKPASGWISYRYKFGRILNFQINFEGLFRSGDYRNHVMACYLNAIRADLSADKAVGLLYGYDEQPVQPSTQYIVKSIARVRSDPYHTGNIVRSLSQGDLVTLLAMVYNTSKEYWYKVSDGWLYCDDVAPINSAYGREIYNILTIMCPVNAEVYDSSGTLVASIVNNAIGVSTGSVKTSVSGDLKQFFILGGLQYNIKLAATGDGAMRIIAQQYDPQLEEILAEKSFSYIGLTDGKQMTTALSGEINIADVRIYVVDDQGNPIAEVMPDGVETPIDTDFIPGDANDDGAVDIMDLVNIIDYIVNGNNPASMSGADANGDGTVDIIDLVYIIDLIVNPPVNSAMRVYAASKEPASTEVEVDVPFGSTVPITALEVDYTLSPGLSFVNAECPGMTGKGGRSNAVFTSLDGVTSGTVTLRVKINAGVTTEQCVNVTAVTGANTVGTRSVGIAQAYPVSASAPTSLSILQQPVDTTVVVGSQGVFTVVASGAEPLTFQWYINRNDGSGWVLPKNGTENQYTSSPVTPDNNGYRYFCQVTDANRETINSETVTLTVVAAPQTGDSSHVFGLIALALAAAGFILMLLRKRRRV